MGAWEDIIAVRGEASHLSRKGLESLATGLFRRMGVARRILTATGSTATALTSRSKLSKFNDPMLNTALSAVLISSSLKHSIALVVSCAAGMFHPLLNLVHLV